MARTCHNGLVLAAQLVLVAWLVVAGSSLLLPSPGIALALMVISAVWLPANNGNLEGPVLLQVDADHGLTVADLLTYLGLVLCLLAGWRWRRSRLRSRGGRGSGAGSSDRASSPATAVAFTAVLLFLLGCGLAASWVRGHGGMF